MPALANRSALATKFGIILFLFLSVVFLNLAVANCGFVTCYCTWVGTDGFGFAVEHRDLLAIEARDAMEGNTGDDRVLAVLGQGVFDDRVVILGHDCTVSAHQAFLFNEKNK